jgi:hypothetical protein
MTGELVKYSIEGSVLFKQYPVNDVIEYNAPEENDTLGPTVVQSTLFFLIPHDSAFGPEYVVSVTDDP